MERSYLARKPTYLSGETLLSLWVSPPPANSAPETRRDLDELLHLQAVRSAEQQRNIEAHRSFAGVCQALVAAAEGPKSFPARTIDYTLLAEVLTRRP